MSKDLEWEYRSLADSETPDLWARIEAGLDDKEDCGKKDDSDKRNISHKRIFPIKTLTAVAAACVCVGLIVPIMRGRMGGMKDMRSDTASPADYTANNTTSCEMSPDAAAGDILSDSVDNGVNKSGSPDMNAQNEVMAEGAAYDEDDAVQEAAAEEIDTFRTEVEIIDAEVEADGRAVYKAKVLSCEDSRLQQDSEIRIAASADETMHLEKGSAYELILCEDNSGGETVYSIMN